MHNLPPSAVGVGGGTAPGLRRGKEESSTHAHTNSITKTHPRPRPPLYVCLRVCAHLQRNTGAWWVTDGGGRFGWRPNGSQSRKWLVATQTAPESTVITGHIPIFYLHRKTHVHSQLGWVTPPTPLPLSN